MSETLTGQCHCGAVTFTAGFDGPLETSKCNCSICEPVRFWKAMVPAEAFKLEDQDGALGTYQWGAKSITHHFCTRCGVRLHGEVTIDGTPLIAISVPTLDLTPERLADLPVTFQNGAENDYEHAPPVTSYL